ncbi:MAG TPA: DUF4097 family beta strand repeat-containing protein [Jatrophihabitantaceae bacterium]|jgi:hypothetical protein|nr:DUF4097 family beta strand repeat-containing protein [Jatrophihabitantaceae bacterium]
MTVTTFPLAGPINLDVRIAHGALTVHAEDGITEARVELEAADPTSDILERTVVQLNGNTLAVATPRRGGVFDLGFFGGAHDRRDSIAITVTVPSGTAMKLSTFTAPISTNGRGGSADVAAGAADIRLDRVDGELRLRVGSGNAEIESVTGTAQVRTGSGNARFGEVRGDLTCACGSGGLEVERALGNVRSRSGSGAANLGAVFGDVDLASGSGAVSIGLPQGHSAQLQLTTGSGRVESDLPVDDAPVPQAKRISIRARTGSGDITLFRAAA